MRGEPYVYEAELVRIYDADTVYVNLDLGLGVWLHNQSLRLWGVDAPEVRGAEREWGLQARDWLKMRLLGVDLVVRTHRDKKGKYGRWLAELFDGDANINVELIDSGHATLMDGFTRFSRHSIMEVK